ncbi:MAG: hypothetical protein GXO15_00175, partial [Crenarchaeota archaeon]|nr:hypothetical protein [Thermoproteota archaeon]
MPESLRLLELWLEELRGLGGYRGLVLGHHVSPWLLALRLSRLLADRLGGPVVCVAPREARSLLLSGG